MSDLDFLDDMVAGDPVNEPMTDRQFTYICQLIWDSALTDEQKQIYDTIVSCRPSYLEAEGLIAELKTVQLDHINLAQAGQLQQKELGKALSRICKMPNT